MRFLIKDFQKSESYILTSKDEIHKIVNVLRLNKGDQIILFSGEDLFDYFYEIEDITKKEIKLKFVKELEKNSESKRNIRLFQAIPNKIDKIELILQKGVELGVSEFIFFRSDRSQKLNISDNKQKRLKKIVIEALEQCGGNRMINYELGIVNYELVKGQNIFLNVEGDNSVNISNLELEDDINLFVGPEGGWSQKEIDNFIKKDFISVNLGNRVLRTETASIVGIGYLNFL